MVKGNQELSFEDVYFEVPLTYLSAVKKGKHWLGLVKRGGLFPAELQHKRGHKEKRYEELLLELKDLLNIHTDE